MLENRKGVESLGGGGEGLGSGRGKFGGMWAWKVRGCGRGKFEGVGMETSTVESAWKVRVWCEQEEGWVR